MGDEMPVALAKGVTVRAPTWGDVEAVNELIGICDLVDEGEAEATLDELRGHWESPRFDLKEDAWLAFGPDGSLLAYGETDLRRGGDLIVATGYIHPAHRGQGLGRWLLRRMELRARELADQAPPGAEVRLRQIVLSAKKDACALLESEGYAPEEQFWRMVIDLDEAPPGPEWPDGVSARAYRPGDERAVHELIQSAFGDNLGYVYAPFEEWRSFMMERESFDPSQWFLAVAEKRIIAAVLSPSYDSRLGWIRQVAVDREWRGSGTGKALMRHAFAELRRRGKASVGLVVDSYNRTGAKAFYERCGMREEREHVAYEKEMGGRAKREG